MYKLCLKGSSVAYLTWAFFAIPLMFINLLAAFIWLLGYDLLSSSASWNIFSPDINKIQVGLNISNEFMLIDYLLTYLLPSLDSPLVLLTPIAIHFILNFSLTIQKLKDLLLYTLAKAELL